MNIRWYLDLALVKNVCIGRVHQLPAGPDPVAKGSVQRQASWEAIGMLNDWCDTPLGDFHESKEAAQAAIVEWYEDRRLKMDQQIKKACSAHFSYRPGCVMCKAVNFVPNVLVS
jgi:hypothetical protein